MSAWLLPDSSMARSATREAITAAWLADERVLTVRLADIARLPRSRETAVETRAADWVRRVRQADAQASTLDAFLREYDLGNEEGVVLMCLAEALLRIPDEATAEKLIADKLGSAGWSQHLGQSESLLVNASTWGLMLTGRVLSLSSDLRADVGAALRRLAGRAGEPVIRLALRQAMKLMAQQFVMGRTIDEALARSQSAPQPWVRHSFDMLGEAALTAEDAERYWLAYRTAIERIGTLGGGEPNGPVHARPGISVKLSALHPRYEFAQGARVQRELVPRLLQLAQAARQHNIGLTVDAEEADRLELSLDVIEPVFLDASLSGWEGFGLAVQAFQRRALPLIDWLHELAGQRHRRLAVRLVKGAYWDTEIKRAQEQGLSGYPVFTTKPRTDLSYLACARRLLDARTRFYPMLATHNAHSVAAVTAYAGDGQGPNGLDGYEFQRLQGMGEALYAVVREDLRVPCRIYAPVGSHEDLLPYLVRRLLENGANTSFVNRIHDAQLAPEQLVMHPRESALQLGSEIPLPVVIFGAERRNSAGFNLADVHECRSLANKLATFDRDAAPVPALTELTRLPDCVERAVREQPAWDESPVEQRGVALEAAAAALEQQRDAFLHLLVREAGKTIPDALAEVREAVDFLRYYALQARRQFAKPLVLPGPTGEANSLHLRGRGVFACISPWNFPLAIFTGQIAAALVAGNTVIAKPAEQTPRVAVRMAELLHAAGIPRGVLQLALGPGEAGAALVADARIAGVAFTGSLSVAQQINRQLAAHPGAIPVLIAETGGQNVMIADSSALPEQLVRDALKSAFGSAGQRCSSLRILYVQEEIAARVIELLRGAMRELVVGDPAQLATDVGPLIDPEAGQRLQAHVEQLRARGQMIEELALPASCGGGNWLAPCLASVSGIEELAAEHFGPILHVARFRAEDLDAVVDRINAAGYGLTLGVHSRIEASWRRIANRARVGNVYVNRGMTGAVVGSQPFGGEGLSGTGPKTGGPHTLLRFTVERALCVNTAAVGGDAQLLRTQA